VSPATRLSALLVNATYRPLALMDGSIESPSAGGAIVSNAHLHGSAAESIADKISAKPFVSPTLRYQHHYQRDIPPAARTDTNRHLGPWQAAEAMPGCRQKATR